MESPCIDICQINAETRLCEGCWRSIDEIAAWGGMTDSERRAIMDTLQERRASQTQSQLHASWKTGTPPTLPGA